MKHLNALILVLFVAACGSDPAEDSPDGGLEADASNVVDASPPSSTVFAVGTDNSSSGILSAIDLSDLSVSTNIVAQAASSDPVLEHSGDQLFIVNRFGADNVTVVDIDTRSLVKQVSTGSGSNPQDVAVAGRSLYTCEFNTGVISIFDLDDLDATPTTIDVSSYDTDGIPNCASIVAAGDWVFASFGLLDENFASQGGSLLVIDPNSDTVTKELSLAYNNPLGNIMASSTGGPFGGDIIVATTESFDDANGCIERISTGSEPESSGCLAENSDLGGYATDLHEFDGGLLVSVSTSFTEGKLVQVDSNGGVSSQSLTPASQNALDFALCPTGEIVTKDASSGGLRVFASDKTELTTTALDLGLPPVFAGGIICI